MLDGAGYNAPVYDDGKDEPEKPDPKTQPVDFLRWQLTHAAGVPGHLRKPTEEVEAMCKRFEEDIAAGRRVWSEEDRNWVKPRAKKQPRK